MSKVTEIILSCLELQKGARHGIGGTSKTAQHASLALGSCYAAKWHLTPETRHARLAFFESLMQHLLICSYTKLMVSVFTQLQLYETNGLCFGARLM